MNFLRLILISLLLLSRGDLRAQNGLFESNEPLTFHLETDLGKLVNDIQDERGYHDGIIKYQDQKSVEVRVPVRVKTRGNFRREKEICPFPPLMLNFAKNESDNGWFTGQDKLKLVTHCNTEEKVFEKYLLKEYLAYRIYNALTDLSLRVRLVEITYSDAQKSMNNLARRGFLIENIDDLADRISGDVIQPELNSEGNPDYYQSTLLSIYQFMIGNTDWFLPDHNIKVIVLGETGDTVAIPYDFDLAGWVNVHYSTQYQNLGLKSSRDRFFMGFCRTEAEFAEVFSIFKGKREPIIEMIEGFDPMDLMEKRDLIDYLDEFYRIIDDPGKIQDKILMSCGDDF